MTSLVLLLNLLAPCSAAGSLPALTIPDGFGVNIHFTGASQDLDPLQAGGFRILRMDFSWSRIETLRFKASEGTRVDMLGQARPISWQTDQLRLGVSGGLQYLLIAE